MLERFLAILLEPITQPLEALMATVEELKGQIAGAKESLQAAIGRVEEDVAALRQKAETGIDPADLEPISQGLSDLKTNLDSLDPDPSNPAPPEPTA